MTKNKYQKALNKLEEVCLSLPSAAQGEEMGFSSDYDFDHNGYETEISELQELIDKENTFEHGVIYAVSTLIRVHGESAIALNLLKESGIDITKSNAPNFDLAPIYDALGLTRDWSDEE